ncbi:MAG: hypothetical protein ACOC9W_00330 [Persicimonas sp.]
MKRNPITTFCVYLIAALSCAAVCLACATPSAERSGESEDAGAQEQKEGPAEGPSGPFATAEQWAAELDADSAAESIADVVAQWQHAQVERVWAAGEQYRAVIVQKSTTGEVPAVLLVIARGDDGRWQVVDERPTTSTHLWSEL